MIKKRKQYSSEFNAKVAIAAIQEEETVPQLASRYGTHPTQINSRKRHLVEQSAELFSRGDGAGRGPVEEPTNLTSLENLSKT